MKVTKEFRADRLQTNIMLSERYGGWFGNNEKGQFVTFQPDVDDDWQVIWSNAAGSNKRKDFIGVQKYLEDEPFLPEVVFMPQENDIKGSLNIVNSDSYYRGRVLQYLNKEAQCLGCGEYLYYKGLIRIE